MAISNRIGPPVVGDDFYGRVQELAQAHKDIESGHSLLLSAPRRIGKSSIAIKLIQEKKAQGWKCVYIDLEGINSKEEFLTKLIENLRDSGIVGKAAKAVGSGIEDLLRSIKGIGPVKVDLSHVGTGQNPYQILSNTIDHNSDTLIVIDELALFLGILSQTDGNDDEVRFLLNWFRSLRQITDTKVRWVFCGSVGLTNFTSMRNLSMTINDLKDLEIGEMTDAEATGLVKALAEVSGLTFPQEVIEHLLEELKWNIPYFIQLIVNILIGKNNKCVTDKDIDDALESLVHSRHLSTWSERLAEYKQYENAARSILNILSAVPEGMTKKQILPIIMGELGLEPSIMTDTMLSQVLGMLEHDGYLLRQGPVRSFRSPLVRKWWNFNFVE